MDGIQLLTPAEAAAYLRMSKAWLALQRMAGTGPQYIRLGTTSIRYLKSDLNRYIEDGKCIEEAGE